MFPAAQGYDRAITMFSPDGRLYQVEYALETIRRGTVVIGLGVSEGVVLAGEEKTRKLQKAGSSQKIFQIDDHLGLAASGYIPDARVQVDQARILAQSNRLIYDEASNAETVAKKLADMAQQFTQYAGVRPFGVSTIIAGYDDEPSIYVVDPSGTYVSYKATAIGSGGDQATEYLEDNYSYDMSLKEACILAIECIYLVSEDKFSTNHLNVSTISEDKKMRKLSSSEIEDFASNAKTRSTSSESSESSKSSEPSEPSEPSESSESSESS